MSEERNDFNLEITMVPGSVVSNIQGIKAWIDSNVEPYLNQVVTADQAKFAKHDLAMLRKVKSQLEDERKRAKAVIMKPYTDFESLYKDAIASLDRAIAGIDGQLKAIEAMQKDARRTDLMEYIMKSASDIGGESLLMRMERKDMMGWFFDEKWLNASVSMTSARAAINERLVQVNRDIECIAKSAGTSVAFDTYYRTGSLSAALDDDRRARKEADMLKAIEESREEAAADDAESSNTATASKPAAEPAGSSSSEAAAKATEETISFNVPALPDDPRMQKLMQVPTILEFPRYKMPLIREVMTKCGIKMLNPNTEQNKEN